MKIVQALHIVHIQIPEHLVGGKGHGGGQIEVGGVCRYFHIIGKLQLILVDLQVFLKAGKTKADYDGMASVVDDLAVAYLNIGEVLVVKDHAGQHHEGNVDLFLLAVYGYGLLLLVGVFKPHGHLAALSGKLLRLYFLAVQRVGYLYIYGKLLFQSFLAVGVGAVCLILQPVACHDLGGIAVGIGDHINGLVLG